MKRWLYQYDTIKGSSERLAQTLRHRVRELLGTLADGDVETTPQGELIIPLPARILGRAVRKTVRMYTGVAEQHGARTCIPLRWQADPGRYAFPTFEGMIELEPQSRSTSSLAIVGAASLPLGLVGAAADSTVLNAVADRTIRHMTTGLAEALEQAAIAPDSAPVEVPVAAPDQLRVRDVMTPDPLVLHERTPLKTAAQLLFYRGVAGAPVVSDAGGLVGVLSEADLLDAEALPRSGAGRAVDASRRRTAARTVGDACTRPALEVAPATTVSRTAELMRDRNVARLAVVDGSAIVGVVSRHDVLQALIRSDADAQAVLDRMLVDNGEDDVVANVDRGIAYLTGHVSTRSRAEWLEELAESIDGIVGVDVDVMWEVDDVVPPAEMV